MTTEPVLVPLHRQTFFAEVRRAVFGGHLSQPQVEGMNAILDEWERGYPKGEGDLRHLGYILGTARGEVGAAMQPIEEHGRGAGHSYGRSDPETGHAYFGRGFVQLTWKTNYAKLSKVVGADLVSDPCKALDPKIAAKIIIQGMLRGLFTGKRLSHFFKGSTSDWAGARRIVNGTDRAHEFADLGQRFHAALVKAKADTPPPPMPQPSEKEPTMEVITNVLTSKTMIGIAVAALSPLLSKYGVTDGTIAEVVQAIGLALATYGRATATKAITGEKLA